MIYQNSRPLTQATPRHNILQRRFELRDFLKESHGAADLIRERFKFDKEDTRLDQFFLLPGRRNQIAKLNQGETFEIKTLIEEEGPLELWETTVESKVPLRRTLAKTIAARIPKFSGPIVGSMTPEELTESLSKKTRFFRVKDTRELFKRGDVTAEISHAQIDDGTQVVSIAFESPKAEPLLAELKALGLRRRENTNFGAYLMQ